MCFPGVYPLSTIQPAPNPQYPSKLPEVAYAPWDEIRIYDDVAALNLTYPFQLMPEQYQVTLVTDRAESDPTQSPHS